jgi:hypothetical protein
MEEGVARFRNGMADWVNLFERINGFAIGVRDKCKVEDADRTGLFAMSVFFRSIATYEGSFILAARGLDTDAKILLRALVEHSLVIAACARNRQAAEKFISADEDARRKLIKGMLSTQGATENLRDVELRHLRAVQADLEERKATKTLPNVTYRELAQATQSQMIFIRFCAGLIWCVFWPASFGSAGPINCVYESRTHARA